MNENNEPRGVLKEEKIDEMLSGIIDEKELAEKKALLKVFSQLGHGSNQAHEVGEKIKSVIKDKQNNG